MRLSFHTKGTGPSGEVNVLPEKYSVGKIIDSAEVCKIDKEKSEAVFDLGENIKGSLHKSHLSDHEEHCNNLFERLSVSDILEDLIVIDVRKTFQRNSTLGWQIVFSKKPSFLEAKEFFGKQNYEIETKIFKHCEHRIPTEGSSLGLQFIKKHFNL